MISTIGVAFNIAIYKNFLEAFQKFYNTITTKLFSFAALYEALRASVTKKLMYKHRIPEAEKSVSFLYGLIICSQYLITSCQSRNQHHKG